MANRYLENLKGPGGIKTLRFAAIMFVAALLLFSRGCSVWFH